MQKQHKHLKRFPFTFNQERCRTCQGACCNGSSGLVRISRNEMTETAAFLGMSIDELINRFLFKRKYRFYLNELKKGDNYSCIFYSNRKGCMIYHTRPQQCRSFPFWDEFALNPEKAALECPGVTLI